MVTVSLLPLSNKDWERLVPTATNQVTICTKSEQFFLTTSVLPLLAGNHFKTLLYNCINKLRFNDPLDIEKLTFWLVCKKVWIPQFYMSTIVATQELSISKLRITVLFWGFQSKLLQVVIAKLIMITSASWWSLLTQVREFCLFYWYSTDEKNILEF